MSKMSKQCVAVCCILLQCVAMCSPFCPCPRWATCWSRRVPYSNNFTLNFQILTHSPMWQSIFAIPKFSGRIDGISGIVLSPRRWNFINQPAELSAKWANIDAKESYIHWNSHPIFESSPDLLCDNTFSQHQWALWPKSQMSRKLTQKFTQKSSSFASKSPIIIQKSHTFAQKRALFTQVSPTFTHKSPTFPQNSPMITSEGLVVIQKSPRFTQKSLVFTQMSPTFTQKSPIFIQVRWIWG